MKADAATLQRFEQMLGDTIRSAALEHAPLIRKVTGVGPEYDLSLVIYGSFFGHTLEMMARALGREKVLEVVERVLGQVEAIHETVREAATVGVTLDPYAVTAALEPGEPPS